MDICDVVRVVRSNNGAVLIFGKCEQKLAVDMICSVSQHLPDVPATIRVLSML